MRNEFKNDIFYQSRQIINCIILLPVFAFLSYEAGGSA